MPRPLDALNYPYIRVRSADWLKRTLLVFPHVARMTPFNNAPADDPEVEAFCWQMAGNNPLLYPADLFSETVWQAQRDLVKRIDRVLHERGNKFRKALQDRDIKRKTGETAKDLTVWEQRLREGASFQIHREKLFPDLIDYLIEQGLAWEPDRRYWDGPEYIEMNPRLGEAVMATVASACAESEGLRVVTEFPNIHGRLLDVPRDEILEASLNRPRLGGKLTGEMVAEFLVYKRCDVSNLTPGRLAALKSEKDALADFRAQLEILARDKLPPQMLHPEKLQNELNSALNEMFLEWRRDEKNISGYAREVFGDGASAEPLKVFGKAIEDLAKPSQTGAVAATAVHTVVPHLLTVAQDVGIGLGVAIILRATSAFNSRNKKVRTSPYRYLTALQDHGVSFQLVG